MSAEQLRNPTLTSVSPPALPVSCLYPPLDSLFPIYSNEPFFGNWASVDSGPRLEVNVDTRLQIGEKASGFDAV
jgi:hypothetical protein